MADSRKVRCIIACLLVGMSGLALGVAARHLLPPYLIRYVRDRSTRIAKERFQADVEFGSFDIDSLFPLLRIHGQNVALRKRGRAGTPTLILVKQFSLDASLLRFLATPAHVQHLELEGMVIHIPPRTTRPRPWEARVAKPHYPVIIDHIECDNSELDIFPQHVEREPLRFRIHQLLMENVGLGRSAPYQVRLTNAIPRGEIGARGNFGPWQPDEPSLTALSGSYSFSHADLDPLPGISGTLDSSGHFEGILGRIVAEGETSTPNFALDTTGHPVSLNTQFHAIIDGTSGDTELDPVKAQFLHSALVAHGGVFGLPGKKGKAVLLDVVVRPGRLEDLLRLGVKAIRPPMTGDVEFHTQMALPPGQEKISQRLILDGRFVATSARSTNPELKSKLKNLSRRAEGKPKQKDAGSEVFALRGRFLLRDAIARFPDLTFTIPGATVNLKGSYGLNSEQLDFYGKLRLQAKLSQSTTGIKSLLLKAVDPFFRGKDAATVLPIKITGPRSKPVFGLAFHHRMRGEHASLPR